MKNLAMLAGSGLLSAGVALAVVMLFQPAPPQTDGSGELALRLIDDLTSKQAQQQEQLDRLRQGMQEAFLQGGRVVLVRERDARWPDHRSGTGKGQQDFPRACADVERSVADASR